MLYTKNVSSQHRHAECILKMAGERMLKRLYSRDSLAFPTARRQHASMYSYVLKRVPSRRREKVYRTIFKILDVRASRIFFPALTKHFAGPSHLESLEPEADPFQGRMDRLTMHVPRR